MRVSNPTESGVFVKDYGVIPAGGEATVRESESVNQQIRDGQLSKVKTSSSSSSSSTTNQQKGDAS